VSIPFGNNPPLSKVSIGHIDWSSRISSTNLVIDRLNAWMAEYEAPFPPIERVYGESGNWTAIINNIIDASNQFFAWGYGNPNTPPIPHYISLDYTGFTSALNNIIAYWAVPLPPPAINEPPVNTTAPYADSPDGGITASVGDTLTCTMGTWENEPDTYVYQWWNTTAEWASNPINGATTNTYIVADTDNNMYVFCELIASNVAGSDVAISNIIQVGTPVKLNEQKRPKKWRN
jgi:hypothetical protein